MLGFAMSLLPRSVLSGVLLRSVCRSSTDIIQISRASALATTPRFTSIKGDTTPHPFISLAPNHIPVIHNFHTSSIHKEAEASVQQQVRDEGTSSVNSVAVGEPDKLYSSVEVECRGHEPAVLRSYFTFVSATAGYLDVPLQDVEWPKKHIRRWTLLKSVHIHKKHRVQYETRTHFLIMRFVRLTSSTADTFLEYIQRNLPEGVSMKVTKNELQKLPEHIK